MEGDGGTYRVTAEGPGRLRIEIGGDGFSFELANGFINVGAKDSDDRLFILNKASASDECAEREADGQ